MERKLQQAPNDKQILTIHSPDNGLSLEFCPAAGGCITSFLRKASGGSVDLFRPWDGSLPLLPGKAASFPMTPVSNRISNCLLQFEGETLPIGPAFGEEPNYLHGDGWTSPWDVASHGDNQAVLRLKKEKSDLSPYAYEAEQVFILEDGVLHIDIAIINTGRRLPFGTGHHPYFPRNSTTMVRANLPQVWLCDHNMQPTELVDTPEPWNFTHGMRMTDPAMLPPAHGFRGLDLMDNCFPGWDGRAEIIQPDYGIKIVVTADPVLSTMVIYNPPPEKDFFVLEAVSNVIDAFNQMSRDVANTGAIILNPGEMLQGRTNFEILDV